MKYNHTPGPWNVVAIDWTTDGNARFEIQGIARTGMADASLIAAAPELLEALVALAKRCEMDQLGMLPQHRPPEHVFYEPLIQQARAAIAKATGGQS